MEVLRSNFGKILPQILENVKNADFISIDVNAESTGFLKMDESLNLQLLKGRDWYNVLKVHQRTRSPLEFGFAVFKQDTSSMSSKRFKVQCFNIPILFGYVEEHDARQHIKDLRIYEERLDIDAMGFEYLQKINFDLDKAFYDGTPYMNKERMEEAVDYLKRNPEFMTISGNIIANGGLDRDYFPKLIEKVETDEDIEEIIQRMRGIAKIFDATAESKVPVVGHNLLIKLLMLYKDFVEWLPDTYSEFLKRLEKVLPHFYDTKYICENFREVENESEVQANALECKQRVMETSRLNSLYRSTAGIGKYSLDFILDEDSSLYQSDWESFIDQSLEENMNSVCNESAFRSMLTGIVFTKLSILLTGSFEVERFPEYEKLWKNQMFIQAELKEVLHDHETQMQSDQPIAHSSSSSALRSRQFQVRRCWNKSK